MCFESLLIGLLDVMVMVDHSSYHGAIVRDVVRM